MQIKLKIGKENKKFSVPYFSMWVFRRSLELAEEIDLDEVGPHEVDILSEFIVAAFEDQFTIDEFLRGVSKEEGMNLAGKILSMCINNITEQQYDEAIEKLQKGEEAGK
jgi:hypothetical protein